MEEKDERRQRVDTGIYESIVRTVESNIWVMAFWVSRCQEHGPGPHTGVLKLRVDLSFF